MTITDERPEDERQDAELNRIFAAEVRQWDWRAHLGLVAKAQALLWYRTPVKTRQALIQEIKDAQQFTLIQEGK